MDVREMWWVLIALTFLGAFKVKIEKRFLLKSYQL